MKLALFVVLLFSVQVFAGDLKFDGSRCDFTLRSQNKNVLLNSFHQHVYDNRKDFHIPQKIYVEKSKNEAPKQWFELESKHIGATEGARAHLRWTLVKKSQAKGGNIIDVKNWKGHLKGVGEKTKKMAEYNFTVRCKKQSGAEHEQDLQQTFKELKSRGWGFYVREITFNNFNERYHESFGVILDRSMRQKNLYRSSFPLARFMDLSIRVDRKSFYCAVHMETVAPLSPRHSISETFRRSSCYKALEEAIMSMDTLPELHRYLVGVEIGF